MNSATQSSSTLPKATLRRLSDSPLFTAWREGFTAATGLDLWLTNEPAASSHSDEATCSDNSFCSLLNKNADACRLCRESHRRLTNQADRSQVAHTATCFAGFRETAVPLRLGEKSVAWLRTGGVLAEAPQKRSFEPIREALADQGIEEKKIAELHKAWLATAIIDRNRYAGTVTLLAAFALQLADLLNRILLEDSQAQPEAVCTARRYLDEHLEDKITLDEVASHVGISPFHFCKVFKDNTGMTLTEYVNRRRVEQAKHRLLHPDARVTEIAFDIGFQSLSQFNRSFARYVGMSPTQYRQRRAEDDRLQVA
jgi:AraC-like DNA-binding protein/ligand-binding sensor protein